MASGDRHSVCSMADGEGLETRIKSESQAQNPVNVAICACTYKRPQGLRALLKGVTEQRFEQLPRPDIVIVIVDNEGNQASKQVCSVFLNCEGFPITYVHEQRPGISHARNACLDNVPDGTDFVAMIDDDEIPEPDWLESLLIAQTKTDADVLQGRVIPVFEADAPKWIRDGEFFGWPNRSRGEKLDHWVDCGRLTGAATNNALVRWSTIEELNVRFNPEYSFTGSEDLAFFQIINRAEKRFFYAEKAVVKEIIPRDRASLAYLMRVEYRSGNNKLRGKGQKKSSPPSGLRRAKLASKVVLRGCAHIGSGILWIARSLLTGKIDKGHMAIGVLRIANGSGVLASSLGLRYEHYR